MLLLATHPVEVASTRFRVLQYVGTLRAAGYEVDFQPFFTSSSLQTLYSRNSSLVRHTLAGLLRRIRLLRSAPTNYDCIFVHRELFPLSLLPFFKGIASRIPLVYDFDDAIFLPQRRGRFLATLLERPESTTELIRLSTHVIAGNEFLADYARRFNTRVSMIPTVVDTERFKPPEHRWESPPVVGWIGSHTTYKYLRALFPVLEDLRRRRLFVLRVVGCPERPHIPGVPIETLGWKLDREVSDFQGINIGLYPLFDDDWSRGKCGFKGIQYMSVGVPVVASAVGSNCSLVSDGVNGYLVRGAEEWGRRLETLIDDPRLRDELGTKGRETIVQHYSVQSQAPRLVAVFDQVLGAS